MSHYLRNLFFVVLISTVLAPQALMAFEVQPAHTGSWYDPLQSGHGFLIEVLDDERALVWWFTFDSDGNPSWFGGIGQIQGDQIVVEAVQVEGGFFPPAFDPEQTSVVPWGTITITFVNCGEAIANWSSALSAYPDGEMNLVRLTGLAALDCDPPAEIQGLAIPSAKSIPVINGVTTIGEWDDALPVEINIRSDWTVTVSMMADGSNLYLLFENLAGPGRVNDVAQAQADTLFPEIFFDSNPTGPPQWDNQTHWFHASFQDCYLSGNWNEIGLCNFDLPLWDASNWPLPPFAEAEVSISYRLLGLEEGQAASANLLLSMTSALLSADTYHNWPEQGRVDSPPSWTMIALPGS